MKVEEKKVVSIDYTLCDKDGQKIDSSEGTPLAFIQGSGQLIKGLESAMLDKKAGDEFEITVQPVDAYGERDESMQKSVGKKELAELEDLQVGMQLEGVDEAGEKMIVFVKEITDTEVVLDANHPLAGTVLYFAIKIVEVRDATADELKNGHIHTDACSHD